MKLTKQIINRYVTLEQELIPDLDHGLKDLNEKRSKLSAESSQLRNEIGKAAGKGLHLFPAKGCVVVVDEGKVRIAKEGTLEG